MIWYDGVILTFVFVMMIFRVVCATKTAKYKKQVGSLRVGYGLERVIFVLGVPPISNYISSGRYECIYETSYRKGAFFGKRKTLCFKFIFDCDGKVLGFEEYERND